MPQRHHSPNGRVIVFKEILIGDCEDPQLYAAVPLYEWEKSEHGNWVMNHAIDPPEWQTYMDYNTYGYKVRVYGRLTEEDEIIYRLKFGFQQQ